MERPPVPGDPGSADRLFAAWLARREPFEVVLAAHPEHAQALRVLHADWIRVEPLLKLAGLDAAGFAERLRAAHGDGLDPEISLDVPEGSGADSLLERLGRKSTNARYRPDGEIARGGMGAILRVWDEDIRRHREVRADAGSVAHDHGRSTEPLPPAGVLRHLEPRGQFPIRDGDGLRSVDEPRFRACRGGSFGTKADLARSSTRWWGDAASALDFLGVRPARTLTEPIQQR